MLEVKLVTTFGTPLVCPNKIKQDNQETMD